MAKGYGAGADVNAVDKYIRVRSADIHNKTPLHYAVQSNYANVATLLIKAGADCAIADADGETVFDIASPEMSIVLMKALWQRTSREEVPFIV